MGYFNMLAAIPGFFLSSLFFMLLWDPISSRLGLPDVGYTTSMLVIVVQPSSSRPAVAKKTGAVKAATSMLRSIQACRSSHREAGAPEFKCVVHNTCSSGAA